MPLQRPSDRDPRGCRRVVAGGSLTIDDLKGSARNFCPSDIDVDTISADGPQLFLPVDLPRVFDSFPETGDLGAISPKRPGPVWLHDSPSANSLALVLRAGREPLCFNGVMNPTSGG